MKKQIFAVCDREAEYTRRFCDYIRKKKEYPFETVAFTSKEKLKAFCEKEKISLLLISEKEYDLSVREIAGEHVVVLKEERGECREGFVYKYQSCEAVLREVMGYYAKCSPQPVFSAIKTNKLKLIGMYSPVHRCMQTTFAITLGQLLAKKSKVLYLNFESFSGFGKSLDRDFAADLSDLIYYVSNAREAFFYKLKGMTETIQNLDYIPPAFSYMDINRITQDQWFILLNEVETHTSYQYLILDLSDNMQGLFEILRKCQKIFTLVKDDGIAMAKIDQYERMLSRLDYEDIKEKTRQLKMPVFHNISWNLEQMTHGEMADLVGNIIKEEFQYE